MRTKVALLGKKKIVSWILPILLVVVMSLVTTIDVYAATGKKKVNTSGKMSVALNVGTTGNSNIVSIPVSGLPSDAVITKLEVNTGSLSFQGGVATNYLTITSSNGRTERISWGGAGNTTLTTRNFIASPANGTYLLSFNSTCIGGAILGGRISNIGTKTYTNPYITIYWDDTY